jgi:hypothetical protein
MHLVSNIQISKKKLESYAVAQAVTALSLWRFGYNPRPIPVELVVDKVALGIDFSEYFGFCLLV